MSRFTSLAAIIAAHMAHIGEGDPRRMCHNTGVFTEKIPSTQGIWLRRLTETTLNSQRGERHNHRKGMHRRGF